MRVVMQPLPPMLRVLRVAASLVLFWESLTRAFWPLICCLLAWASVALIGAPALLPHWAQAAVTVAVLASLAILASRGMARFCLPRSALAERRLERDSGLNHRPFAVLRDAPASGAGSPLWQLHQQRARTALARLRLGPPDAQLATHDPFALRAAAALLMLSALIIAGPQAWPRLTSLALPAWPSWAAGAAPQIQGWVLPPAYTGQAPIFLPAGGGVVTVPTGSRLTLSITGADFTPRVFLGGARLKTDAVGDESFQSTAMLAQPGQLSVGSRFSRLAQWELRLLANEPPRVAWAKLPGRAGTSLSTVLPWRASQRWGVAAIHADILPAGHDGLAPLRVPLALAGTPKSASGEPKPDLSANPYAGLKVTGRLVARDVAGQEGTSDSVTFVLPGRDFHHPLARAIVDLRRQLALHPQDAAQIAADLSALAEAPLRPAVPGLSAAGVVLNMQAAAAVLAAPGPDSRIDAVQARLWNLALALDGALGDASAAALEEARDNLRRGLDDHAQGKLSDRELHERLQALRQALNKRLDALARQAMKQGALQNFDPKTQHLSSSAIDHALEKLERAMREGRTQDARQALAQLNRLMDQLKNAHIMSKEEAQAQVQQASKGRQQMGAVDDMVQRETTLLDHAQARAPRAADALPPLVGGLIGRQDLQPPGTPPQGTQDPAEAPDAFPPGLSPAPSPNPSSEQAMHAQAGDARTQRALHRALDALKQAYGQSGHKPPAAFDDASHAMSDAASALAGHDDPAARDAVGRAIAALQQGGQAMSREQQGNGSGAGMQLSLEPGAGGQTQGDEQSGDEQGDGQSGIKRDPFGRQVDGNGTAAEDPELRVPDDMEQGRSRAIQEELRRRGADRARPKGELDYIDRLLRPF